MKKILLFNDCLNYGGTETLLVNLLHHIAGEACEVTLLLPVHDAGDILLKDVPDRVNVAYIYPKKLSRLQKVLHENLMSFFPSLYAKVVHLDLKKYDLIVSFKDSVYSAVFARARQPKILWIHNLPVERKYTVKSLKEWLPVKLLQIRSERLIKAFRRYNDVVFVSNASMNNYTRIYNQGKLVKGQNLQVIYNAIELSKIGKLSLEACNTEMEHPMFIMVGRFSVEKRIDRVIKAARRLKNEGYNFKIKIIGDGLFFEDVKRLVAGLSLSDTVSLPGYINNPYPHMKSADWLICSSEKESFSLVVLESIYLGTPVITTDCGGPTEISANGEYALLTGNSSDGVYRGMKKALDEPSIAGKYTSKADECLKRFDYNKWLDSVDKILGLS
ncbi:glycosyltransferase [Viscerimonas tarda]